MTHQKYLAVCIIYQLISNMRVKPSNMGIYVIVELNFIATSIQPLNNCLSCCCLLLNVGWSRDGMCSHRVEWSSHHLIGLYNIPISSYFVTEDWGSKHFSTLLRWLFLAHQFFLPPELVHPVCSLPYQQHCRIRAMKTHPGFCGSAEWPKLPLRLGVMSR